MNIFQLAWAYIDAYWKWFNSMDVETVGILPLVIVGCITGIAPFVIGIIKRRYVIACLTGAACVLTFLLVPMANILTPIWVALVFSLVQLAFGKKEKSEIDITEL